jgi:sortase (surface protein transpeptidase)
LKRPFNAAHRRLALILLLVVGGGTISFVLLHHGEQSRARVASAPPAATTADVPAPTADEAAAAPAATSAPGAQYSPIFIHIPAIKASAPIDPLGLNPDGSLQVPKDFARAGYYTGRPPPGGIGPAIVVAHVDSKSGPAVFAHLRNLKPGDEVTVTRVDRQDVVFVVDRVQSYPKNKFPTKDVYDPTPGATLRLITCGGSFDRAAGHYRNNVIAFAHYKALVPSGPV